MMVRETAEEMGLIAGSHVPITIRKNAIRMIGRWTGEYFCLQVQNQGMDPADPELIDAAKNWLAMDGLWFLAVEEAYGLEKAMEMDRNIWASFSRIEAERIKKRLRLPENGGLEALDTALRHRLHSLLNPCRIVRPSDDTLCYFMLTCRTQSARQRKGLPPFPCQEIGLVEYSVFAETIDSRIRTACIACPPDPVERAFSCGWKFTLHQ